MDYVTRFFLKQVPLRFSYRGEYDFQYPVIDVMSSILVILLPSLIGACLLLVVLFVLSRIKFKNIKQYFPQFTVKETFWTNCFYILLAVSFIEFVLTTYFFIDNIPHVTDSLAYLTQAKLFAMGNVFLSELPYHEHFFLDHMILHNGKWFSQYPFGHPLLLSIGYVIKLPWITPSIIATVSLILIFLIGKLLYSEKVGFFTAFLAFSSPFFKMNSSNFMSHNSALAVTLLFTYFFILLIQHNKVQFYFLAGISLGFLINIRPYTALLVSLPFFIFLGYQILNEVKRQKFKFSFYGYFFLGLGIMLFLYGGYNKLLTESLFQSSYTFGEISTFGFSAERPINHALYDMYLNFYLLEQILLNWPLGITFIFFILYLFIPSKNKWEYLFTGIIISVISGYSLYKGSWMMYGPRLWYEMVPFFFLLTIVGVEKYSIHLNKKNISAGFILYSIVFCCSFYSLFQWYKIPSTTEPSWYGNLTPKNIHELPSFNVERSELMQNIKDKNISNAIIFIKKPNKWWQYGIPAASNDFSFKGEIIFAQDLGIQKNKQLLKEFPNRQFYLADYMSGVVIPYE